MDNLNFGDLVINIEEVNERVVMKWLGKSRDREPSLMLNQYFNDIINDIIDKELTIDFSELEYMNSSTIPSIIKLFKLLDLRNINTKILYDDQSIWQNASFKALSTISKSMDNVNVEGIS